MAPRWSVSNLLTDVRRAGQLPAQSTASLDDASLLLEADRVMQTSMVPLLLRVQEEWFVRRISITLTAGTANYPIPRRAIGSRVRDVWLVRGSGRTPLPRLMPERVLELTAANVTGVPIGFYLDASDIVLVPAPSAADTLQVAVYVRPGRLVATLGELTTVTANSPAAGRTALAFGTLGLTPTSVDIISALPPFEYKAIDAAVANGTATAADIATTAILSTLTVSTNGSTTASDFVTVTDTSPVPQIPVEAWGLFVQRIAASVLWSLGYLEEASAAEGKADKMERDVIDILTPRTDGSPRRVTGGLMRLINRGWGGQW